MVNGRCTSAQHQEESLGKGGCEMRAKPNQACRETTVIVPKRATGIIFSRRPAGAPRPSKFYWAAQLGFSGLDSSNKLTPSSPPRHPGKNNKGNRTGRFIRHQTAVNDLSKKPSLCNGVASRQTATTCGRASRGGHNHVFTLPASPACLVQEEQLASDSQQYSSGRYVLGSPCLRDLMYDLTCDLTCDLMCVLTCFLMCVLMCPDV